MQTRSPPHRRDRASSGDTPTLPDLDPGVTLLRTTRPRSPVLHRLALQTVRQADGRAYWVDARNTASTYALHECAAHRRLLERLRIARAFTAYQHVSLIERLVNAVTPRTGCLVLPNAPSLYRDDDVPAHEAAPLFEAAVGALREVCTTYDVPLLVTDAGQRDDLADSLASRADVTYRAEPTDMGYRVEGGDFETTIYWDDTGWQTTIPYWVELYGVAPETRSRGQWGPVTPAMLGGT